MTIRYETTRLRVFRAIFTGAALGALFVYLDFPRLSAFVVAFILWFLGIVMIGGPVWMYLHRKGWRQWWVACLTGAAVPYVSMVVVQTRFFTGRKFGDFSYYAHGGQIWENGMLTEFGWKITLQNTLLYAIAGLFIGLVIWRIAYRRSIPGGQP